MKFHSEQDSCFLKNKVAIENLWSGIHEALQYFRADNLFLFSHIIKGIPSIRFWCPVSHCFKLSWVRFYNVDNQRYNSISITISFSRIMSIVMQITVLYRRSLTYLSTEYSSNFTSLSFPTRNISMWLQFIFSSSITSYNCVNPLLVLHFTGQSMWAEIKVINLAVMVQNLGNYKTNC